MTRKRLVRGPSGNILGGKGPQFGVPLKPGVKDPGRESMEVYWHPDRPGSEPAPADFAEKLHRANADLACCRPPARAPIGMAPAWIVWYRRPRVTHPLSPGWLWLFAWRNDKGEPEPLDERVFAVLYASSAFKWNDGRNYFERGVVEVERTRKASRERAYQNHRKSKQREFLKSHRISSAGDGSRSALHDDGSIIPSPGEMAWREERRNRVMPSEQLKAEREAEDKARAGMSDLQQALAKLR